VKFAVKVFLERTHILNYIKPS